MKNYQIKHRFTDTVLFELKTESLKVCLEIAVKRRTNLGGADLRGTDLRDANLGDADLRDANLRDANLRGTNLRGADLWGANLRGTYLGDAHLGGANLGGTNLRDADLRGTYLRGTNLRDVDLGGTNLGGTNLRDADLRVKEPPVMDHRFASEILWRKAKTETQKDFAARIRMETNQCWSFFIELARKKKVVNWATKIFSQWEAYKQKIKDES